MGSAKNGGDREEFVGMTTPKSRFSEWFSEVISKTKLADIRYNIKGFIVFREWSVLAMEAMYDMYEREMQRKGHKPVWFPAVIPESNFMKEAEHVEGFIPEVFWITHGGENKLTEKLALRPTSETAMYTMYSKWVRSWRDLPLKVYQRCQVWRHETKSTRPFIRSREFHWIEGHNVFATLKGAEDQVKEDMSITESVMHQEFGVPFIFMKRPAWDTFPGAVHTYAADSLMPDRKIIQQPSTHLLGQNFSKPFDIKFADRSGKERYGWQTCYGPAISRIIASVIALHGDDCGLRFPFRIAPLQVIIVPINPKNQKTVSDFCGEVKDELFDSGLRVEVDGSDYTPGWKFNQWEMKGVPIRLEIGPREAKAKSVTLVRRDTGDKKGVPVKGLLKTVMKEGELLTQNLRKQADAFFRENMHEAKDMPDLKKALSGGGFVRCGFCSIGIEGVPCAERVKDELHGDVRGERSDTPRGTSKKEKPSSSAK
ncbi:MAG: proline--tRNA ligase, partial [Candidatus Aenigmarchaeota archaeon]|nr:proline--tRNA ligase [Candidatus Aenigmarchaeota archaeon]